MQSVIEYLEEKLDSLLFEVGLYSKETESCKRIETDIKVYKKAIKILQVERETDSTNKGAKEVCPKCASPMRYVLFCSNPGCSNSDGF